MRNQRRRQVFSTVVGFFWDAMTPVRVHTLPRRVVPILVGFVLLAAIPAAADQPVLPIGVPNIYDPKVQAHFDAVGFGNLRGNPDFPVVLLMNTTGEGPRALLLALDARNGKDTWALTVDPIILIVVFPGETAIRELYVDTGFVDRGKPSGDYAAVDDVNSPALPDLLDAVTTAGPRTYI